MQAGELRNPENAVFICEHLESGMSLREVAELLECSPSNILKWADADAEFGEQYAKARTLGYRQLADELLAIADNAGLDVTVGEGGQIQVNGTVIKRSALKIDTRKWLLSKMLPKVYGEAKTIHVLAEDAQALMSKLGPPLAEFCRAEGIDYPKLLAFLDTALEGE